MKQFFCLTLMVASGCMRLVEAFAPWLGNQCCATTTTKLDAQPVDRRQFVSSATIMGSLCLGQPSMAEEEPAADFASIAARAAKISKILEESSDEPIQSSDGRTIFDFSLPISGQQVSVKDLVNNENAKAVLVVNIKQDDPLARKNIPELLNMASKYGRNGEFVVICAPTDQGYFEPDTSALIRLKMDAEYGYGSTQSTVLTDKMNLLGTGAHPFWRWIEGTCRTPAGVGSIQGNFEKFLVNGATGLPVRRYPRRYAPFDIRDDIEALLRGRPLPPAGANYLEEWRTSVKDGEKDTYRFQKGLNVFDQ